MARSFLTRAGVALLLAAACLGTWAAPPAAPAALPVEPHFTAVGVGAIPRGVVASMVQDRAGFLWIATGDGLVRHDGYRFRPQERESPNPAERNLGWIRALLAAGDGRVWIGTESDGLAVYDPASDRVTLQRSVPRPQPTIRALAEDRDGAIWVALASAGLERVEPGSGRVTRHRHDRGTPGSLPDDRVFALRVDRQGTLWVGSGRGLSRRAAGSPRFEPVFDSGADSLAGHVVQSLFEAADGRLWVGTQQGGVAIVDPATGQGRLLPRPDDRGAVSSLVEAVEGRIWVGHAAGIDVHDAQDGRLLQRLRPQPQRPGGLAGQEVTALLRDQAGALWVAGLGLGLQRHDPTNRGLWVRSADPEPGSPFAEASARSLLQRDDGEVWVAIAGGGVAVLDAQLRSVGALRSLAPGAAAPPRVEAMAQTGDGAVWLATEGWLHRLDRQRRVVQKVARDAGPAHRLVAGRDGGLWLCTQDGLHRLAPGAERLQRVNARGDAGPIGEVHVVAEAEDRSLWVGASSGLYRLPPGAAELEPVDAAPGAGLGNPTVIGLLFDRRGVLWLDTAVSGLHRMSRWDGRQASFERISERHGVVGRPYGVNLLEDRRGRIWTQQYVYDPASDRLDEITEADGKHFGTGWFHAYARARDGRLLFGGSKGLLVVDPEQFAASGYAPPLVLSELRVNGLRQPAAPNLRALTVAPRQRSFSVEFAALDYSDPARLRYAYRLQGFDPDWIATGADFRAASYSNLDPGRYVLQVRATNRSGVWSPHELAVAVQVLPAWWQRWEVRAVALLLLAALLYAALQWRTQQLRARQRALERKVQERTAALEESSLTDPLTGLRNRRFLTQHIGADVAASVRRHEGRARDAGRVEVGGDLLFFLVDIDHFKQVNDLYGHAAGDAVLQQMRERLRRVFRDADYLVRWGGEEFLIVARDAHREHAAELAERARQAVAGQPFVLDDGRLLQRTCSLGFACFPLAPAHPRALDWSDTVSLADAALYAAKSRGRDGWVGVLDAGTLDEAALRERRPVAPGWVGDRALTVLRS